MSDPLGDFLVPSGYAGPRGLGALAREGSTIPELRRAHRARQSRQSRQSRRSAGTAASRSPYAGHGRAPSVEPVLLVPGFLAGDYTLGVLAARLRREGYRTYRSGITSNAGCTAASADRLERRLEDIAERRGRPVSIVGHSLGGMLARALATRRPDLVAGIVTLGSPVLAPGAVHPVLMWNLDLLTTLHRAGLRTVMSADCVAGDCARTSWEHTRTPLPAGLEMTAVYSRRDGIVDWRSCLDPQAAPVEVTTSHCGMAFDPTVQDAVLHALRGQQLNRASRRTAAAS